MDKLLCIITGPEHNGTTLIEKFIYSHPNIFGGFETGILLDHDFNKNSIPFNDWIYHSGLHWGLSKNIKFTKKISFNKRYELLFKNKGTFHNKNKIQKLIYESKYLVDKTPAYIRRIKLVHKNIPINIPVIIVIKNFKEYIISLVVKRNTNLEKTIKLIKKTFDNLKYIKDKKPKNFYLFQYNDIIEHEGKFIEIIKKLLKPKINMNCELSVKKYEEKIGTNINEPYKNWKKTKIDIDKHLNLKRFSNLEKEYNNLINFLKYKF